MGVPEECNPWSLRYRLPDLRLFRCAGHPASALRNGLVKSWGPNTYSSSSRGLPCTSRKPSKFRGPCGRAASQARDSMCKGSQVDDPVSERKARPHKPGHLRIANPDLHLATIDPLVNPGYHYG